MRLSVLDLVPVRSDQSTGDALAATVALAQTADRLGFTRYWLAEHHNMPSVGATSPPVLIAYLAAQTTQLRLGSGGVMLPNHAPLAVAEQFALLEAAAPGRIDLGIGRAPGSDPVTSYMLRAGRGAADDSDIANFPQYLDDVAALMSASGVRLALRSGDYTLKATPPPPASRDCGCWGPRCTRRSWPPPRACRTCSPIISPGKVPKRRLPTTASTFGPAI